jgi:UDP-glucose 4-epimerase
MKILLTGGAGYIGSHIAVELLNAGREVVIADNLSNLANAAVTASTSVKARTLPAITRLTGKTPAFFLTDVCDANALSAVFEQHEIGAIVHLAGFKGAGASVKTPLEYYRNNLDSTLTLLETMRKFNVKKLVFSSSACVYSGSEQLPWTEETATGECENPYGTTKRVTEQIITDYSNIDAAFSSVFLRYFNPIGAIDGELRDRTIANLVPYIDEVADGKRPYLEVFGDDYPTRDGTNVRDYLHVADLARGHLAALEYADRHTGIEVFNLSTGKGSSNFEVVKAYERANNVTIPVKIAPRRAGDLPESYANPSKAANILGWTATRTLDEMLHR